MVLFRYNYNEGWNSDNSSGNRFTHAENMNWDLVGSPFLSSMNYGGFHRNDIQSMAGGICIR